MMIMDYICIQKKMEEDGDYSARDYDRKNLDGDMTLVFCGCVNLICSLHSLDMLCVLCSAVYICGIAMLTADPSHLPIRNLDAKLRNLEAVICKVQPSSVFMSLIRCL